MVGSSRGLGGGVDRFAHLHEVAAAQMLDRGVDVASLGLDSS